jgi:hypothetical protein
MGGAIDRVAALSKRWERSNPALSLGCFFMVLWMIGFVLFAGAVLLLIEGSGDHRTGVVCGAVFGSVSTVLMQDWWRRRTRSR